MPDSTEKGDTSLEWMQEEGEQPFNLLRYLLRQWFEQQQQAQEKSDAK